MGIGWGVAYQIYFSAQLAGTSRLKALILFWGVFISAWIGAKLLFLVTYPEDLQENIIFNPSFWTGGGFVFYGGLLGALAFLLFYRLFDRSLKFITLWPMVPALAFGHSIGRIGCFLAGCCFGKPTELFWGVYMHQHDRHPTQLIESIGLFLIGLHLLKSKSSKFILFSHYLIFYGVLRFAVELLRGDLVRGSWGSLTPSQWISLALVFCGLCLRFFPKFKDLRTS